MNDDDVDLDDGMNDAVMIEDDDEDEEEEQEDAGEDEQRRIIIDEVVNDIRNVNIVDGRQQGQRQPGGGNARDAAAGDEGNGNDNAAAAAAAAAGNNDHPAVGWENRIPDVLLDHPAVIAFLASNASFLVTDPNLPGNPIIYASEVSYFVCEATCMYTVGGVLCCLIV